MTKERTGVTSYPLYWPTGWTRTRNRRRANFRDTNVYRETQAVRHQMDLLRARRVVVSTNLQLRQDGIPYANQRIPEDPGVAVWFQLRQEGEWAEHVLACDRWDRAEHNLRAIAKHVEALRGQERWGVGSVAQAFRGYQALPETASGESAWSVLGIPREGATLALVDAAFKRLAPSAHPDHGGDPEAFHRLTAARQSAREELLT